MANVVFGAYGPSPAHTLRQRAVQETGELFAKAGEGFAEHKRYQDNLKRQDEALKRQHVVDAVALSDKLGISSEDDFLKVYNAVSKGDYSGLTEMTPSGKKAPSYPGEQSLFQKNPNQDSDAEYFRKRREERGETSGITDETGKFTPSQAIDVPVAIQPQGLSSIIGRYAERSGRERARKAKKEDVGIRGEEASAWLKESQAADFAAPFGSSREYDKMKAGHDFKLKEIGEEVNRYMAQQKALYDAGYKLRPGQILSNPAERLAGENAQVRGNVGSIAEGLKALRGMETAMKKGLGPRYVNSRLPVVGTGISDDEYTAYQRVLTEIVGRLQSGAAMSNVEVQNFDNMGPRPADPPEVRMQKLAQQRSFLMNKLRAFGYTEQDLAAIGLDAGGAQTDQVSNAQSAPAGVRTPEQEARYQELLRKAQGQ